MIGAMGPLHGVKILEFGSIGPGPFAATLLANMGAEIIRLRRPDEGSPVKIDGSRSDQFGRPAVPCDLKSEAGRNLALRLAAVADAIIEGNRPGVMERLGLGPDVLLASNPRLVYGRITGYGQDGPMASVPGHDINYIAMSGALGAIGRVGERPQPPVNLLGDYGAGGMLLAFGLVCGVLEARRSGHGQVVDAAMVDGAAQLASVLFGFQSAGAWGAPGTNVLDSGAPFYDVYETEDGRHVAVGAIEPQFYADLLDVMGLDPAEMPQWDRAKWPEQKKVFADVFAGKSRDEWTRLALHRNACLTPVLSLAEAPTDPHNVARGTFADRDGLTLPHSAPRFSRTPAADGAGAIPPEDALAAWGLSPDAVAATLASD